MIPQPDLIPINNRGQFQLVDDYAYTWQEGKRQCRFIVRKGSITDKASTPRFSWILGFTHDGLWDAAATVHDRLYQIEGRQGLDDSDSAYQELSPDGVWTDTARSFTRQECDKLFLRIMQDAGVTPWRANVMYWAVEHFGELAW